MLKSVNRKSRRKKYRLALSDGAKRLAFNWYAWRESNSRTQLRRLLLYPLSYRRISDLRIIIA